MNLETIARKLDKILNGIDTEIPTGLVSPVTDKYFFHVFSQGLYLSEINNMNSGKNFIPVVVGAYGGENNPVPDLGEKDRNVTIQLLFPVRFKEQMYDLEDYLDTVIVGKLLTFGSQKAVCNLSPAQFGELQDFSFDEFNRWVTNNYKRPLSKLETYMSMEIVLYLSTAKNSGELNGFVYGNTLSQSISIKLVGAESAFFTDDSPVFVSMEDNASVSPASQQLLGESSAKGLGQSTAYVEQVNFYFKANASYTKLLEHYKDRKVQDMIITLTDTYTLPNTDNQFPGSFARSYYISNITINFVKGALVVVSIALGDFLEV